MSQKWKRPKNLEFPKTYHNFKTADSTEYIVQDLPINRYGEAIDFLVEHYTPDEPIFQSRNAREDLETIKEFTELWYEILEVGISQICLKFDSDEIIGINLIDVDLEGVKVENKGSAKNFLNQCQVVNYCLEQSKLFETFQFNKYIRTCELSVHKKYRNKGIATEMLKAMKSTMEFLGFELVTTGFSAIGSAKAAVKAGYNLIFEIPYSELPKINPELSYPGIKSPSYKQMYMLLNNTQWIKINEKPKSIDLIPCQLRKNNN